GVEVSVTDVRGFLPSEMLDSTELMTALIEPDGALRAFPIYEAKVGNVLDEPMAVLWERAIAWRMEPFVKQQMNSVRSMSDWARVARNLDRRYGSTEDVERIRNRTVASRDIATGPRGS
ncbi:MAG: hypothetical protein U1D69_03295, partial [Polynucleobacter sp.]|nr:hypothetical protein [Polynucleobacter sp.]